MKHYYRNKLKTANNKYYFEYLLLAIIQPFIAVLAYYEHFPVIFTAIIQLNGTLKINTENYIYTILLKLLYFTQIASETY